MPDNNLTFAKWLLTTYFRSLVRGYYHSKTGRFNNHHRQEKCADDVAGRWADGSVSKQIKKPGACAPGFGSNQFNLREEVIRRNRSFERAFRAGLAVNNYIITTTSRALGDFASRGQLDIRRQVVEDDGGGADFLVFQRPLVDRRVNLAEVVDAGIGLRGRTGFDEVRNRDRSQQADDGHHDHDFNQRETRITDVFRCLHFYLFFLCYMRRELHNGRV